MVKEADIIYHLLFPILSDRPENEDRFRIGWGDRDFPKYGGSIDGCYHHVALQMGRSDGSQDSVCDLDGDRSYSGNSLYCFRAALSILC